ncbi:MAG TPA: LysR family transcriptional regulator [Gemmatimonadaceae bacterium]|nr:LysR family transcriptional regulator [Gemmatimonadaceae bacterium]
MRVRILSESVIALGPGKADLLDAIADSGSISAAARKLRMSYRRAWILVDTMNACFVQPLVGTEKGGSEGGGASLTETGRRVLAQYRKLAAVVETTFAPLMRIPTSSKD